LFHVGDFGVDDVERCIVGDQSGFSISNGLGTNPHKLLKGNNLGRINYIHIGSILIKVQLKTVKQSQHFLYGGFIGEIL
jgi:hypothetical protein